MQGNNQEKDLNFKNKFTHEEELGSIGDMMTNLNIVEKMPNQNQGNFVKKNFFFNFFLNFRIICKDFLTIQTKILLEKVLKTITIISTLTKFHLHIVGIKIKK